MSRRQLRFHKISGAGNDFIILDGRDGSAFEDPGKIARGLCRRGVSVGADGLVLLTDDASGAAAARMQLWNADGSAAEFSGNAARCAARFLAEERGSDGALQLRTDIGTVAADVDGPEVRVAIPGVAEVWPQRRLRVEGRDLLGTYVRVGVPFFVLLHEDPDDLPVRYLGRAIRHHPELAPAGANVDFVRVEETGLYFRVYERGVENETLSSGTGSIAAALAAGAAEQVGSPVACRARGGTLTVAFTVMPPSPEPESEAAAAPRPHSGPEPDAAPRPDPQPEPGSDAAPPSETPPADEAEPSPPVEPALPPVAVGPPLRFGDITVSGETRRVMLGQSLPDALRR